MSKAKVKKPVKIDVHHVTRVEGHGNIVVDIQDGKMQRCDLQIVEAPRFFEAMLRGQPYEQASHLSSRICGICAVTHATTSLRATENALGIVPSRQTALLRKLNLNGEMLDSHILHVYMLVAPDFLGVGSVIPLAKTSPEVVLRALRMKKLAGDICSLVGGRHTHPVSTVVGGFTSLPDAASIGDLHGRLLAMREDLDATINLFQGLSLPNFERDTEFLALSTDDEYCFMDGAIASSDGGTWPIDQYLTVTNEHMVDHSTAKHAQNFRQAYMVGALARFNINYEKLHDRARQAASALGLQSKCINPYWNSIAQIVEMVHCTEDAILITERLLDEGILPEDPVPVQKLSGEGVGACEAPRGTLYHHYLIENGVLRRANCVIPTAQNLANIEADMRELVPMSMEREPEEITLALEMLVRAYDPCISCSTHMVEVNFVK
ncbi:MAG TPA: Ni/Fe hydrogenase subunit alpha [Anaerolineae bacterium]|nr:Ni/Fe hydrogenase subunit alpha [Anaerolineae bacterium]